MSASLSRHGAKLQLAGPVAFASADTVCDQGLALLTTMTAEGVKDVVVDLAGLEAPGSVAVAVLLRWARAVAAGGGRLRLAQVPEKCAAILRVSGLAEALPEATA
ncbi:MAG TPA: STAS domain-containing protein [Moraxellaceae bacterium]